MSDEPMLVSERWLTNADRRLRELSAPKTKRRKQGLFYLVRQFYLASNFQQDANGEWTATGRPVIADNGNFDPNVRTTIYAPCFTARPKTGAGFRVYAVLRGSRWEFLCYRRSEPQMDSFKHGAVAVLAGAEYGAALTGVKATYSVPALEQVTVPVNVAVTSIGGPHASVITRTIRTPTSTTIKEAAFGVPSSLNPYQNYGDDPAYVTRCMGRISEVGGWNVAAFREDEE